jgi:HEAT repeats
VLAGAGWPLAASEWRRLTQYNTEQRPVALFNPFGGGEPLKGYVSSQRKALVAQIRRLIGQGFFVIITPNGTAWGSEVLAHDAVAMLESGLERYVAVAPDAGAAPDQFAGSILAHSGLGYADTVTRLLIYFVRFASLIIAVEGWMIHAAYCLGKPYRVLMMAYSHPAEWQPYAQTRDQQIHWPMPACAFDESEPLDDLLVEQPRKFTLLALLRELGICGDPRFLAFVQRALGSPDRDIRSEAAQALTRIHSPALDRLLPALLMDSYHGVRAAAAEGLLAAEPNGSATASVPFEQLQAHLLIGRPQRNWMQIRALGPPACPALEIAARDEDPVVRREAGWALAFLTARPERRRLSRGLLRRGLQWLVSRSHQTPDPKVAR